MWLRRSDAGSVLALVPAGFLVLMLLASLAVDSAVAYLGQQQLHDALSAAANDAVAAGLDNSAFYRHGSLELDPAATAGTVCAALAAQHESGLHGMAVSMAIDGDELELSGAATVDAVFGRAVPGFGTRSVKARASARLESGPTAAAAPSVSSPAQPLRCG